MGSNQNGHVKFVIKDRNYFYSNKSNKIIPGQVIPVYVYEINLHW